ncbi:MAG: helix-turn-helix domain-containing protein [Myxococcales bacterium]|nr:helix-turn-helix domain-containing protein [Myxococcales bacterium]
MQVPHDPITSQRLADFFDVTRQTIHHWCRHKGLPHHRTLGRQLRFDAHDVRAFCETQQIAVPQALVHLLKRLEIRNGTVPLKRTVVIHEDL